MARLTIIYRNGSEESLYTDPYVDPKTLEGWFVYVDEHKKKISIPSELIEKTEVEF